MNSQGTAAYKIACPECGSSDGNQVFTYQDKEDDSYCFACSTLFPSNTNQQEKFVMPEQNNNFNPKMFDTNPALALTDRGIRKEVVEIYGVKVGLSESDGKTITHHYYCTIEPGLRTMTTYPMCNFYFSNCSFFTQFN